MNTNNVSPFHDPLYQLGRNALRKTNVSMFNHSLAKLEKKLLSRSASGYMEAEFRILAAEIARAMGDEHRAATFVQAVMDNPPSVGVDILSRAQRVRASLFLDAGDTEAAKALVQIIDAIVIENSEARGEAMITVNDADISVDTLLLMVEVAFYSLDHAAAVELLIKAAKRLAILEQPDPTRRLSAFDTQQKTIYCAELRYKLHLWQAVLRIVSGDGDGFTLLRDLAEDLDRDTKSDRRLLARVRALLGDFDVDNDAPVGISRNEAMRLFALATRNVVGSVQIPDDDELLELDLFEPASAKVETGASHRQPEMALATPPAPVNALQLDAQQPPVVIERFLESQAATNNQMAGLVGELKDLITKLPVLSAEQTVKPQIERPFAFGGGFAFFDLVTQLANAEIAKFTGYFQVQWSPEMVESTILAGNLDPLGRAGEGFIFMHEGLVIDATIKDYDPPEEFQAGMDGAEADAKRSLTILIQIGFGQKLDCLPDGFGKGYPSAAVKARKPRIRYTQFKIAVLIQERDEELK
jgi:hypothetical protein